MAQLLSYFCNTTPIHEPIHMLLIATVDPILRSHLRQRLTEKGDSFQILEEGENIVDSVFCHQPSLVILDLYLTHPSGLAILRQLRAEGYAGQVVVLGGQSSQSLAPEATRLGALQIVGRPFSANQVLGAARVAKERLAIDRERLARNGI